MSKRKPERLTATHSNRKHIKQIFEANNLYKTIHGTTYEFITDDFGKIEITAKDEPTARIMLEKEIKRRLKTSALIKNGDSLEQIKRDFGIFHE